MVSVSIHTKIDVKRISSLVSQPPCGAEMRLNSNLTKAPSFNSFALFREIEKSMKSGINERFNVGYKIGIVSLG